MLLCNKTNSHSYNSFVYSVSFEAIPALIIFQADRNTLPTTEYNKHTKGENQCSGRFPYVLAVYTSLGAE
jgi:hypothetical protein